MAKILWGITFEVSPELNIAPEAIELENGINAVVDKNNGNKHLLYLDRSNTSVIKITLTKSGDNVETCPIVFGGSSDMEIELDVSSKITPYNLESSRTHIDGVKRCVIKNSDIGLRLHGSDNITNLKAEEIVILDCKNANIECNRDLEPQLRSLKASGLRNITVNLKAGKGYEFNLMNLVCLEGTSSRVMLGHFAPKSKNNCRYTINNTKFKPRKSGDSVQLLAEEIHIEGQGLTITYGKMFQEPDAHALISNNRIYIRPRMFENLPNIEINTAMEITNKNKFGNFTLILDPKLTNVSLSDNSELNEVNFTYTNRDPLKTPAKLKLDCFYSEFKEVEIGGSFICDGGRVYDEGLNSKIIIGGKNNIDSSDVSVLGKYLYGDNVFKHIEVGGYRDSSEQDFERQSSFKKRSFSYERDNYGGYRPLIEEVDLTEARNVKVEVNKKAGLDDQDVETRTEITNLKIIGNADVKIEMSPEASGATVKNVTLKDSKLSIINSQKDKGSIVNCELVGENKLSDINARDSRLEGCEIYEVDDIRDYDGSNVVVYSAKELTGSSRREVKSIIADSSPKIDREEFEL